MKLTESSAKPNLSPVALVLSLLLLLATTLEAHHRAEHLDYSPAHPEFASDTLLGHGSFEAANALSGDQHQSEKCELCQVGSPASIHCSPDLLLPAAVATAHTPQQTRPARAAYFSAAGNRGPPISKV